MNKKAILILVILGFLFCFRAVRASVVINEVELAPTDNRFIELYNSGSSSVSLTGWYIQRKTATGSDFGSLVSSTNFENKTIGAGSYFLISRSLPNSDILLGSFTLTESNTIQIKNSEGAVVAKLGWGSSADCGGVCAPNPSDGQSIQKTSDDAWVVAAPTPGRVNQTSGGSDSDDVNNNDPTVSGTNITQTKTEIIKEVPIKIKILTSPTAYIGQPAEFGTDVFGRYGEPTRYGKIFWNLGDGASLEQTNRFEKFKHTYFYPGTYKVSAEYYESSFLESPKASSTFLVSVVPLSVFISRVGNATDFFVELSNNSKQPVNISGFVLSSLVKSFIFPKNTEITSNGKIILSPEVTGFGVEDKGSLKLLTPNGKLVYSFGTQKSNRSLATSSLASTGTPVEDLKLNDIPEDFTPSSEAKPRAGYLYFWGFALLLLASVGVVYYIRRKKIIKKLGDDFKIIDE